MSTRVVNGKQVQETVPLTFSIPAGFSSGQVSGNVQCITPYSARFTFGNPLHVTDGTLATFVNATIPYTQPNIGPTSSSIPGFASGDNRISINWNGGGRTDYLLPAGLYGFDDVAEALNLIAYNAGWVASPITQLFIMQGISATQKVIMSLNPSVLSGSAFPAGGVVIDFLNPGVLGLNDSVGPILGWPTSGGGATLTIAGSGTTTVSFVAPNVANFALTSSYNLYVSFLKESYINGVPGPLLTTFPLGSQSPNSVASYQASLAYNVPVSKSDYAAVDVYLTDQSGNSLLLSNFQAPIQFSMYLTNY